MCPLVVNNWEDLQWCTGFVAITTQHQCEMSVSACTRSMPGLTGGDVPICKGDTGAHQCTVHHSGLYVRSNNKIRVLYIFYDQ